MEKLNIDFCIPYYIVEELLEYIELTAKGHCKCAKWENIKALLRLAKVNNRLTEEQVEYIIEKFNRENVHNF